MPPVAHGPGNLGRDGVPGAILWAAGGGLHTMDLFADFWAHDGERIDWLDGFLCDAVTTAWFNRLAHPQEEEEEPEEMFSRASMNTLGGDFVDDV